jgi:hypothetical protein
MALVGGLALISAAHAAGPTRPFRVGLWTGGAYSDDRTGIFSDCAALISYTNGLTMAVALNRSFGWTLSFYNPLWTLYQYRQIPIEMHIPDGRYTVGASGMVINPTTVIVPMSDNSRQINAFRLAYRMNAVVGGRYFAFYLNNTSDLMVQLVECVRTSLALEISDPPAPQQSSGRR